MMNQQKEFFDHIESVERNASDSSTEITDWYNQTNISNCIKEYEKYNTSRAYTQFKRSTSLKRRYRRLGISSAAASVLLFLSVFTWNRITSEGSALSESATGGASAVTLTLANGEVIQLSDTCQLVNSSEKEFHTQEVHLQNSEAFANRMNEIVVPRGEEFKLIFPDGTNVWLNSESRLRYPSDFEKNRLVELSGEAFFDVAKTGTPFKVMCSSGEVNVHGTSFDVMDYPHEQLCVTLVTGSVHFRNESHSVMMKPNDQLRLTETGDYTLKEVSTTQFTAWKEGLIVFRDESMAEIMYRIERLYDVQIQFDDPKIKNVILSIECSRYKSVEDFLKLLSATDEFSYEISGRQIRIKP